MRVGCGSATIGIFAQQWHGHVDEVIVVDDHITGVLSEHQAGKFLDMPPTGIRVRGRKSTPGRYFQVANPGSAWGGTDITDPLSIVESSTRSTALAGAAPADGLDHRRGFGVVRARRRRLCHARPRCPTRCGASSSASARTASRRSARVLFVAGAGGQPARRRHREPGRA